MQKKSKKSFGEILARTVHWFGIFWRHSWLLTIIFFLGIFSGAVFIWWKNIYRPEPTQQVLDKFAKAQDDFNQMSKNIQRVITKINDRKNRFQHPPDFSNQRNMFAKNKTATTEPQPDKKPVESPADSKEPKTDGVLPPPQTTTQPSQPAATIEPGTTTTTTVTTTTTKTTSDDDSNQDDDKKKKND